MTTSTTRLQNHYFGLVNSLTTINFPAWLTGAGARLTLVAAVLIFGILYLFQTGNTAVAGYQIHDLENQSADLSDQIKNLEIQVADYSSLSYIKTRVNELDMVAVASFKNLSPAGAAVVALR